VAANIPNSVRRSLTDIYRVLAKNEDVMVMATMVVLTVIRHSILITWLASVMEVVYLGEHCRHDEPHSHPEAHREIKGDLLFGSEYYRDES
jgi:hypothetical protein